MINHKSGAVLCWLATVSAKGQPSVSPKEVWTFKDANTLIIANIASPNSVKNIASNAKVGVSFINIWDQKGKKITGVATVIKKGEINFQESFDLLYQMAGPDYPFSSIISVDIKQSSPIIAPSYFLKPDETVVDKRTNAMNTYGVHPSVT